MQPLLKFPAENLGKPDPVKDQVICLCHDVPASAVKEAVDVSGARTVEEVATLTRAGSSCGACKCRVERLVAGLPAECGPCSFCPGCGYIMKFCNCHSA